METRTVTITIPRSTLVVAGMWCFLAGVSVSNVFMAREHGYSPLWPAASSVLALGLAIHMVRGAIRLKPAGPVPRVDRELRDS